MFRNILGVLAGAFVAMLFVTVFDKLSQIIYHIPDIDPKASKEAIKAFMDKVPAGALFIMLLGWAMAAFFGGLITQLISKNKKMVLPIITGGLFFITTLSDLTMIPHPWWMWIMGLWMPVPLAYWGSTLVNTKRNKNEG